MALEIKQITSKLDLLRFVKFGNNFYKDCENFCPSLILDELNIVLATNMLPTEEVAEFLAEHKNDVEIILTGRGAPLQIMNIADLVTDMKEVKHYFSQNVSSRNGIDH